MTTIVAWAGVDQRAVSSLYIASDSRISWGYSHRWDQGRKTFTASGTPHIFGYWGDALFPSIALPIVIEQLALGLIRPGRSTFDEIEASLRSLWRNYPKQQLKDFGIVMATRHQDAMNSSFEMALTTFDASAQTWDTRRAKMPKVSARLILGGTGMAEVRKTELLWEESTHKGTSRAVYSAFVEALDKGKDPLSGGAPQLVGLRRIGPAMRFGTFYRGERYLAGASVTQEAARAAKVDWYDEMFTRFDGRQGTRLHGAQVHTGR